jgi:hypothetical protein
MFVPVAVTLLAILTAIMVHGLVRHAIHTSRGRNAVARGAIGGAILGAVLTFFAVWAMSHVVATSYSEGKLRMTTSETILPSRTEK